VAVRNAKTFDDTDHAASMIVGPTTADGDKAVAGWICSFSIFVVLHARHEALLPSMPQH
jgi:hypothetical protein